jgi:hypothetical protein
METTPTPRTTPAPALEPPPQPALIDYLLVFLGLGISTALADMSGLRTLGPGTTPAALLQVLLRALPTLLFLPVGVALFWPIFYLTQWLRGRRQGLSAGEWLLGLTWLAALALAAWCAGKGLGWLSGFLAEDDFKKHVILGYIIFMISMGCLALLLWLLGLVTRWRQPWTHTLSLALMLWPAAPLLVVWLGNMKLE